MSSMNNKENINEPRSEESIKEVERNRVIACGMQGSGETPRTRRDRVWSAVGHAEREEETKNWKEECRRLVVKLHVLMQIRIAAESVIKIGIR